MDEQQLILQAQQGDRAALEALLRSVERPIYKTAFYILQSEQDARDVTQEVLLRICRKIHLYEPRAIFKTWVLRITTNLCTDWLRQRKSNLSFDQLDYEWRAPSGTEHEAVTNLYREEVKEALQELPDSVRSVVLLRFVNEWSYQEISETTRMPLNTVKSHIHRARQWLAKRLMQETSEEEVRT